MKRDMTEVKKRIGRDREIKKDKKHPMIRKRKLRQDDKQGGGKGREEGE